MKFFHIHKYMHTLFCVLICIALALTFSSCSFNLSGDSSSALSKQGTSASNEKKAKTTSTNNFYSYNHISNSTSKQLYSQIKAAAADINTGTISYNGSASEKEIFEALLAYKNDNPDVFWLKNSFEYYSDKYTTNIVLHYTKTGSELINAKKQFESTVNKIIKSAPENGDDYTLELYANNYITKHCKYDDEAAKSDTVLGNESDAYGVLVDTSAVCEGYARAFQLLCNKLGVDCVSIAGQTDAGHQWNCAKIDGSWYQVDVTWNDTDGKDEWSSNDYFNLTDAQIKKDHTIDPMFDDISDEEYNSGENASYNLFVPKCSSDKYNYYKMSCVTLTDIDKAGEVVNAISKAAKNKEKYFSIVIDGNLDFEETTHKIIYDSYFSGWIEKANGQNFYNPELNTTCEVYKKSTISVLTAILKYK